MEKTVITFNDLPEVVAQLRDEVMSLRSLLTEQRSVNNAKAVDTHVPMSVDEAAEYLGIPKGTLYMKLSDGSIPATKPGKRYCLYRDELDRCSLMVGILSIRSRKPLGFSFIFLSR